ncbi:odorant receptor 49b-like [Sitodiplosis mosellana]|uniref:odorant receptor 49b-like n=1 Tax=Sitodiplosis mosellana TaxID=263140 RepID=UPI00244423B2|nr:odorant receptor 49b-like [Sitodiplosis mosellana]
MDLTNPETYSRILAICEDLSILIGVYMVATKILYFYFNQQKIGGMLKILEDRFLALGESRDQRICRMQRFCYFQETILFLMNYFNGVMLAMSFPIQPLFAAKTMMPHRARFPFDTSDTGSLKFIGAYIFQSIIFLYLIQGITFVDNIGVCTLNESMLHVKVVAHKFSQLRLNSDDDKKGAHKANSTAVEYRQLIACVKEHQDIYELTSQLNALHRPMFVVQIMASTLIICLTAFIATVTKDMTVFVKYLTEMIAAFAQLLYWCWVGNKMFAESPDVAQAVYGCEWYQMDMKFKIATMHIIRRAQKPIRYQAGALFQINFNTFIAILRGSYSYCMLLKSFEIEE